MKCRQQVVIYILTFLLLISPVLAFDISSSISSISLCSSTTDLVTTTVSGSGSYTVNVAGSAASWTTTVPSGFSTTNQKIVYTYITPPSNTLPGTYTLEITISDGISTKKSSLQVNVLDCFKVNVKEVASQAVCPGQNAKFDFTIQNTGKFQEAYSLSTTGSAASWAVLSQDRIDLDPSKEKTIFAYVAVPQEARGSHEFTLTSKGTTGTVSSSTAKINVQGCFDYNAAVDKEFQSICDHSTLIVPVAISNRGTIENTYNLELNGPSWIVLDKTSLALKAGQTGSVNLIASPDYDVTGDYDISVTIVDAQGKQGLIQPLKINVKDCHSTSVIIKQEEADVCAALTKTFNIDVANSGEQKDSFDVSLVGPSWISLNKGSLVLDKGEKEILTLTASPSINEKGEHDITILVESSDKGYSGEDTLKLNVLTQQECYNPNIVLQESITSIPQESQTTIPVTIENNGTQTSNFILGLSGTASAFMQLNPSTITLDPNTAETLYLYVAPTRNIGLGSYKAKLTVKIEGTNILDAETLNIEVTGPQLGLPTLIEPKEDFWTKVWNFLFGIPDVSPEEDDFIQQILQEDIESEEKEEIEEIVIEEESAEEETIEEVAEKAIPTQETKEEESLLDKLVSKKESITEVSTPLDASNVFNKLLGYRNYILVVIIIILLIILMVKYRKGLLEFFTEEDEEFEDEEPKANKKNKKGSKK